MKKRLFILAVLIFTVISQIFSIDKNEIRILILSGRNNHEWKQTTPFLEKLFSNAGNYAVSVTERPDTLSIDDFSGFDVVLSNWNSWPENDLRWPDQTEKALLKFIENGGGFVTFHSSSSVFYKWPDFQKISTAAWIMDSTSHGKPSETKVSIINKSHHVTKGISDFLISDELWLNAAFNPGFEILATASNQKNTEEGIKAQPAIMVTGFGKGRIFHTILGHDVRAMESEGFQAVLLRGTEWAATGKVSKK